MYLSTTISAITGESGLILAHFSLDFSQRNYAYRFLSLLDSIPTKDILFHTLRIEDHNAQQEDQPDQDFF